jgi:hypothetical protein
VINSYTNQVFGLLFAESVEENGALIEPIYDEEKDVSFAIGKDGNLMPYVELDFQLGTNTETFVVKEPTDSDDSPQTLGTRTLTEVKKSQRILMSHDR